MSMPLHIARALLVTSALISPTLVIAQSTTASPPAEAPTPAPATEAPAAAAAAPAAEEPRQEEVEVSVPGGNEIVVTGRRDRNIAKTSDQVVSVLGATEIARTGEGNIAGALARVTGLSVVGNGFVYVRGLGDRYSLALLNGSLLPSPEPLRRVVPLDIFPSGVIASSLVQKSYSVNFPGEFGGGVINLTTRAVPRDPFLSFGIGISGDSETTGELGYTYFGSRTDNTGFDDGARNAPPALAAYLKSGARMNSGTVNTQAIAAELVNSRNGVVQGWDRVAPNVSANLTGGKSFPLGGGDFGIIAAAGYSNRYTTRQTLQQSSTSPDLSVLDSDFTQVNTDQRIVVNGLLGFGYEFDQNKIRFTNLYIRDTIKQARLAIGNRGQTAVDYMRQKTAWYERQLINSQLVSELDLGSGFKLDTRAGYANSQREAPGELSFEYVRTNSTADPYGAYFVNRLNGNNGDGGITYSDLVEDLYSAGLDLSYKLSDSINLTVGGAWSDTQRSSTRRDFLFRASGNFPDGVTLLRPDLLLQPSIVNTGPNKTWNIGLIEQDETTPSFFARLRNYAGYAKVNARIAEVLSLDIGVRYENATQAVTPIQVFTIPIATAGGTSLKRNYWLPAATLTWEVGDGMQLRFSGSKTIARPQFRELINQSYFDPDSNRPYRGNRLLVDSQLYNAEARFEWYFAPDQRLSVSGFYKRLERPIEAFITGADLTTSFANAPKATLYGAEIEVQKNFNLDTVFKSGGLAERRLILIGNYTYTKSKIKVAAGDTTLIDGVGTAPASVYFRDGSPLTGQSDHIGNIQIGIEHPDRLSQQTLLLNYASDRVISRGVLTTPPQPDVIERPGFRLDFVAREGVELMGREIELKFEARNITGQRHEEFQKSGANRIDINTYAVGTTLALSATVKFQ